MIVYPPVDAATKSQAQLRCTFPNSAAIAAGTYILQVTTLAGGIGTLLPLELKVNLAQAVEPPALFVDASAGVTIQAVTPRTPEDEPGEGGEFTLSVKKE